VPSAVGALLIHGDGSDGFGLLDGFIQVWPGQAAGIAVFISSSPHLLLLLAWIICDEVTYRGNSKILAKIGNSVVEPLLKPIQGAEKMREVEKRNA
jgi:hypothetical protein